ncbi:CHASE domain-containing protein, partial [Fusobacterium mortiferum]
MKNKFFDMKIMIIGILFTILIVIFQIYKHRITEENQIKNVGIILTNKIKVKMEVLEDVTEYLKEFTIIRKGNLSQEDFYKISKYLYSLYKDNEIMGIFYLKGGKVEYIYPLKRNVGTLGLDIFKAEDRKEDAYLAMEKKQAVVSGPYDLYQGGRGLIIRNPIFVKEEDGSDKFIGFSVVIAKFPDFIDSIDLNEISDYNYKITTFSNGEEKLIAKSKGEMTSLRVFTVNIFNNKWKIALEPINFLGKLDGVLVVFVSLIILTLILSNLSHRYKEN